MSYYGYERLRPGDALGIDMTSITNQLSKDLKAYEEKKGKEKESVAQTNRDFAKLLAKMPSTYSENYNSLFANVSNTAMTNATKINNDFKNRNIDKRDYDIKMGNLNTSVGLVVDSVTQFANQINEFDRKAAAGELSNEELWQLQQVKDFSDLGNVSVVFDPESIQANFVKVNQDGSTDMMSANQFFQTINIPMSGPLDIPGAVKKTLTNLTGVQDITTAEGKKQVGRFIESSEGTQALKDAAEAMLAQDRDLRNFATGSIIRDDEGNQVQFDFASVPLSSYEDGGYLTAESLKKLQAENPNIFFQDKVGKWYVSDSQRELILKNAERTLKAAADYTLVEPKPIKAVSTKPSVDQLLSTVRAITGTGAKPPAALIELVLGEAGLSQEEINKFKTDYNAEGTSDTSQIINDAYSWLQSSLRDKSFGENIDKTIEGIQPVLFAFGYDVVKNDDGSIDVLEGENVIYNIKEDDKNAFINLYNKITGLQKRTGIALAYSSAKLADPSIAKKKLPGQ